MTQPVLHAAGAHPRLRPLPYDTMRLAMRSLFRLFARIDAAPQSLRARPGPAIYVINHLSYFDGPLLFAQLPIRLHPVVAARYRRHAFTPFLAAAGAIYVHRGRADRAAVRAMLGVLEEGGFLGVAVEGTRSRHGRLQQAKNGAAYLASKTRAPLVPVAVWGTERIRTSLARLRRPDLHLRIGPAIVSPPSPRDWAALDACTETIIERIAAMLPDRYGRAPREDDAILTGHTYEATDTPPDNTEE